ncbi:hypothetical protein IEI_00701 [Bacillus wiedmannii]|nr:hypothetical protein IEI_00701 [Bacillus wiedmannii]
MLDLSNQSMPRTITARENDRNGFKIVGNLKERGKAVDLTGFAVFYEAISPLGSFVRDIAVITNFRDGVFEYTVSKEAVSSAGTWVGYFAFEKGTERFTTQDIKILLGCDVKQGKIEIQNYISEFDKALESVAGYRKEIDDTNKKIVELTNLINAKNVQVPKLTLDTGGALISISDTTKNILNEISARGLGVSTIYCAGGVQGNAPNAKSWRGISFLNSANYGFVIAKDFQGKLFTNYLDNGTWIGWEEHVTSNDLLKTLNGWKFTTTALQLNGSNVLSKIATGFRFDSNLEVNGIVKQSNDTDWTPLILINGVKQQSSQPASAIKRSGNVVNIVCAITDFKDKQVIANVPAIFRPDREMFFTPNYFQGLALKTGYVIVKPNGDIYLEGIEATVSLYRFSLTYSV